MVAIYRHALSAPPTHPKALEHGRPTCSDCHGTNLLPGTVAVTYNIENVTVVNGNPQITFQILLNGTPATFNAYVPGTTPVTTEMLAPTATGVTLANGPMVGIMMGLPEDGITSPMDSNRFEMDWPMKSIWNGTAFTTGFTAAPTGTMGTNYAPIASKGIQAVAGSPNTYMIGDPAGLLAHAADAVHLDPADHGVPREQCLVCHGPGTTGDIRAVHMNF
ncbi:MAG: hypothetical protein ABSH53_07460 [Holophaga sp.]